MIPKKHYRWVYSVPNFAEYWIAVLKLTEAIQRSLKPFFITYVTHGLEVAHAHIHIMPRDQSNTQFVPPILSINKEKLKQIASSILNITTTVV